MAVTGDAWSGGRLGGGGEGGVRWGGEADHEENDKLQGDQSANYAPHVETCWAAQ